MAHHWAHVANDCDPWWEPESAWHQQWKASVPDAWTEVPVAGHRADIRRPDGVVIELQHSSISCDAIRQREAVYRNMVWLFDGASIRDDDFLLRDRGTHWTFRWKHPRKTYAVCQKPVYIDFGEEVFRLKRLHLDDPPYFGWGYLRPCSTFVAWLRTGFGTPVRRLSAALEDNGINERTRRNPSGNPSGNVWRRVTATV